MMSTGAAIGVVVLVILWAAVVTLIGVCVGALISRYRRK